MGAILQVQMRGEGVVAVLWSAVVAERLPIIGHPETVARLDRTLSTLEPMERGPSGQYFKWYDIRTGAKSPTSPGGDTVTTWLSSVDNGRLAVGLRILASRVPELRARAQRLFDSMDFSVSYLGEPVFEGALPYAGMRVTPSWGGSMFEALMPSLFVPEERWGPGSSGANHPVTVRAQIHDGLNEARYRY